MATTGMSALITEITPNSERAMTMTPVAAE